MGLIAGALLGPDQDGQRAQRAPALAAESRARFRPSSRGAAQVRRTGAMPGVHVLRVLEQLFDTEQPEMMD